jgi:PAS domain S-box-containing protein
VEGDLDHQRAGSPERTREASRLTFPAKVVVTGLVVAALAWASIEISRGSGRVSGVWPANAVVLAALITSRARVWPAFLLAGLVGDVAATLVVGDKLLIAVGLGLCNGFGILFCATGLRLLTRPKLDLSRLWHLVAFGGLAVAGATLSAFGGAAVLQFAPHPTFWRSLIGWALSDMLGLVIVTPALLALDGRGWARLIASPIAAARNLVLLAGLAAATMYVCLQPHLESAALIFITLVLIAFQAEVAGAALGLLVVGGLVLGMPLFGLEPAITHAADVSRAVFTAQITLLFWATIVFPIAGAVARRRELAAQLETTARDFQMLADHSTDIILRIDTTSRIVYVSPSCRQLGWAPDELVGREASSLMHPEDRAVAAQVFSALMSGGGLGLRRTYQQRTITRDGDWVWVEGSPQLIYDSKGRPAGVVTQLRDITARKQAETALAESEARYRLLADRATDIILQTDAEGVIRYISPACRRLGYAPEEMIGRQALEFIHEDDRHITVERLRGLFAGTPQTESERREYRALPKDGGPSVWLEGNSSVVHDEAGRIVGAVSLLRDVTERRAFEDELHRKRAEAEAATIAKSEFLANMSHEIRTPLTGIMGFAGLLEDVGGLPPTARTFASRIATASRALLAVVNDILDFSKIEAGQIELHAEAFDPGAFVAETTELVMAQAQEKRLTLTTRRDGDLPAAVSADAGRLRQVLLNLLTNAVKFTDAGGVTVTVSHADAVLRLEVADTGVGIAPDRTERLFQRFSQADGSINRQYGGTGLGLAICKSLTQVMGGQIGVASEPGRGSTFWFSIAAPRCAPTETAVVAAESELESRPARILVVDDSPVNRELVGVLLSVFGHHLTEAGGGAEAVLAADANAFDLILMDLQMPGMDGLAATKAIRARCPLNRATPIVALSANILPIHLEACREAGMDDHIAKPIDTRELLTKVARWTTREEADSSTKRDMGA